MSGTAVGKKGDITKPWPNSNAVWYNSFLAMADGTPFCRCLQLRKRRRFLSMTIIVPQGGWPMDFASNEMVKSCTKRTHCALIAEHQEGYHRLPQTTCGNMLICLILIFCVHLGMCADTLVSSYMNTQKLQWNCPLTQNNDGLFGMIIHNIS